MLVPAAVLLIPLAVANVVARVFLLGRDAAIVNHDLHGTAAPRVLASDHAVEVMVRPDGTPVLAYRAATKGPARLLVCHTRDCTDSSDIGLSDGSGPPPALALDRRGWPLAATYQDQALVLFRCRDAQCTSRDKLPLAAVRDRPGHLDLALTPDGRPQVLWADHEYLPDLRPEGPQEYSISLRLTTCAAPDCR